MRAAIYPRVSKDRTGAERSVIEQERECRALCAREGWEVVRVFPDNDRSASRYATKPRKAFTEMREFIASGGCDVVVYWEASRSTRDLATFVDLRDLCRERNVRLSYSGRLYDLRETQDQFQTGLDALLAEQESARTSDRVRRSVRANAAAGRPHGRNMFGYRRVYDDRTGALLAVEIDGAQAAVLREAARRVIAGDSLGSVVRWMNAAGSRTLPGNEWRGLNLRRCLTYPAYMGKRLLHGQVVGEALWPAMYDEDTYARLCAILNDPGRRTGRGSPAAVHLLSNIARCGVEGCGGPVRGSRNNGRVTYRCTVCSRLGRLKEPVDRLVVDVLLTGLSDPAMMAAFGPDRDDGRLAEDARAARAAAVTKRARLQTFYDSAAAGEITAGALSRIEARLMGEIEQHERMVLRSAMPAELSAYAEMHIPTEWGSLPLTAQRSLIRYFLTVEILPWGKGRRVFDPASVRVQWRGEPRGRDLGPDSERNLTTNR